MAFRRIISAADYLELSQRVQLALLFDSIDVLLGVVGRLDARTHHSIAWAFDWVEESLNLQPTWKVQLFGEPASSIDPSAGCVKPNNVPVSCPGASAPWAGLLGLLFCMFLLWAHWKHRSSLGLQCCRCFLLHGPEGHLWWTSRL
jgi:hypothetical protein